MNSIKEVKQMMDKFTGMAVDVEKLMGSFAGATKEVERIAAYMERQAAQTVEKFNRIFGDAEESAKGGE